MPVVKKKDPQSSAQDLIQALQEFAELLDTQDEDAAAEDLRKAAQQLKSSALASADFKTAIAVVLDAFEGDHELSAYTFRSEKKEQVWSIADQLYLSSTRVLNLAKRLNLA